MHCHECFWVVVSATRHVATQQVAALSVWNINQLTRHLANQRLISVIGLNWSLYWIASALLYPSPLSLLLSRFSFRVRMTYLLAMMLVVVTVLNDSLRTNVMSGCPLTVKSWFWTLLFKFTAYLLFHSKRLRAFLIMIYGSLHTLCYTRTHTVSPITSRCCIIVVRVQL